MYKNIIIIIMLKPDKLEKENVHPRDKAEEVIDKLNQNGRLMRPTGYDTLQIV